MCRTSVSSYYIAYAVHNTSVYFVGQVCLDIVPLPAGCQLAGSQAVSTDAARLGNTCAQKGVCVRPETK